MSRRGSRALICVIMTFLCPLYLTGCGATKPIDGAVLQYFQSLNGQKYWTSGNINMELHTDNGLTSVMSFSPGDDFIEFGDVEVVERDSNGNPTKAVIFATVTQNDQGNKYRILVTRENQEKLVTHLRTLESDEVRTARLERERQEEQQRLTHEREVQQRMQALKKKLTVSTDEFSGNTTVSHPLMTDFRTLPRTAPRLLPMILYDNEHKSMIMMAMIVRNEWLFMDSITVKVGDFVVSTPKYTSLSDNVRQKVLDDGNVFETIIAPWTDPGVEVIGRAIAEAPLGTAIRVRLSGSEGNVDYTMTRAEHQAWKDMVFYYDNLKVGTE